MSLRIPIFGALTRALLALAGVYAAVVVGAWPMATACFAALSVAALLHARGAERREGEYRRQSRHDPLPGGGNCRPPHGRLADGTADHPQRFALLSLDV